MKKMIFAAPAVLMALAVSTPSFSTETKVALCEYCNSPAFRNAAEVTALQESPRLQEGVQFVFVVDIHTDEIRYYEVVREYVETCLSTTTADTRMSSGSLIDPDDPPDIPDCFSSWVTSSTQLAPPAATVAEIRDMQEEFDKFRQEIQEYDISELSVGFSLDSASDLIGLPSVSHDPGFARTSLQNALSSKVSDTWAKRRLVEATQTVEAFIKKLVDLELPQRITITFPDDTEIDVQIISPFKDEHGSFAGLILEVVENSARGEEFSIPTTLPGFQMVFGNERTGDPLFIENMADLFVRGGGRVTRSTSGGGCLSSMKCWVEIDPDNGTPKHKCRVTAPNPQLSSC